MNLNAIPDDSEDSQHTPAERAAAASRSTWISVGVNIFLPLAQVTVGILSRLQALLADGIHSLSDLVADFVVLFASHHRRRRLTRIIRTAMGALRPLPYWYSAHCYRWSA